MAMGMCLPAKWRRWLGAMLALCMVASPSGAVAANSSDGMDAKQEAKARFVSGQSHYNLNEFAEALGDFKEAYRLLPDPVFLYNLGQCERQLSHPEEAIRFYRSFLREQPKAANRQEVARKIDEMEANLRAKAADADKGAPPPAQLAATPNATSESELPQPAPTSGQQEISSSPANGMPPVTLPMAAPPAGADKAESSLARIDLTAASSVPAASESPAFYSRWWFWPAAGVLAVGAGIGIYAAMASRSPAVPSSTLGSKKVF